MNVVDRILRLPELEAAPPVLVDVGAAQGMHPRWRRIAKYAVCIAFEADDRELRSVTSEASGFRRLITHNAIAAEGPAGAERFYLTTSPFCSSRLAPLLDSLGHYAFAPLFRVERTVELGTLGLGSVLAEHELERVDWIKIDSQGTDLRLFQSLDDQIARRVLVAEFEPGLIDAYEGEDLLADVLEDMRGRAFWVSDLTVRGSTRIESELAQRTLGSRLGPYLDTCHKTAPGWAEIEYFNDFADEDAFGKRELLLGCAFAFVRGHNAFALELAGRGRRRFGAPFEELEAAAVRRIRAGFSRLPFVKLRALARRVRQP